MAKRRVNKSALIKVAIKDMPEAPASQIVDALALKKVKVTPGLVYAVKASIKKSSGKKRRKITSGRVSLDDLMIARSTVERIGSVAKTREALDVLVRLS